jgi:hypothetical protein
VGVSTSGWERCEIKEGGAGGAPRRRTCRRLLSQSNPQAKASLPSPNNNKSDQRNPHLLTRFSWPLLSNRQPPNPHIHLHLRAPRAVHLHDLERVCTQLLPQLRQVVPRRNPPKQNTQLQQEGLVNSPQPFSSASLALFLRTPTTLARHYIEPCSTENLSRSRAKQRPLLHWYSHCIRLQVPRSCRL